MRPYPFLLVNLAFLVLGLSSCSLLFQEQVASLDAGQVDAEAGTSFLSELHVSGADDLDPIFNAATLLYTADVTLLRPQVQLTAIALDSETTIFMDGVPLVSGEPSPLISLDLGVNTLSVEVISAGQTRTYTVQVDRGGKSVVQTLYGKASNAQPGDNGATSMALSGDTLVIGALLEDGASKGVGGDENDNTVSGSGAVYVFRRIDGVWGQEAYIKASSTGSFDSFGAAVSISGDLLAVGAPFEDSESVGVNQPDGGEAAQDSGAVYVFRRMNGAWAQEAYIKASNTGPGDNFGAALSLHGDSLAVGAPKEDSELGGIIIDTPGADTSPADDRGAVYIFRHELGVWQQQAFVKAANPDIGDTFGESVSIYEDTLAVGASNEDGNGVNLDETNNDLETSGAVYTFTRKGEDWKRQGYIKASTPGQSDRFGNSLALGEDMLVVGAVLEDSDALGASADPGNNDAPQSGAAYVFARTGDTWNQQAFLKAGHHDAESFGYSVAIHGELIAVGARQEKGATCIANTDCTMGVDGDQSNLVNDPTPRDSGAAYLFSHHPLDGWVANHYIKASNAGISDQFANSIAISGDQLVVGAHLEDGGGVGLSPDTSNAGNNVPGGGAFYFFE